MINPLSTSLSGMMAATKKLAVSASNLANAQSKGSLGKTDPNRPYLAMTTVDTGVAGGGVKTAVVLRTPAYVPSYDPDAAFADEDGMVAAPNVNVDEEIMTGLQAKQAYQANAVMLSRINDMSKELTRVLDKKA